MSLPTELFGASILTGLTITEHYKLDNKYESILYIFYDLSKPFESYSYNLELIKLSGLFQTKPWLSYTDL